MALHSGILQKPADARHAVACRRNEINSPNRPNPNRRYLPIDGSHILGEIAAPCQNFGALLRYGDVARPTMRCRAGKPDIPDTQDRAEPLASNIRRPRDFPADFHRGARDCNATPAPLLSREMSTYLLLKGPVLSCIAYSGLLTADLDLRTRRRRVSDVCATVIFRY